MTTADLVEAPLPEETGDQNVKISQITNKGAEIFQEESEGNGSLLGDISDFEDEELEDLELLKEGSDEEDSIDDNSIANQEFKKWYAQQEEVVDEPEGDDKGEQILGNIDDFLSEEDNDDEDFLEEESIDKGKPILLQHFGPTTIGTIVEDYEGENTYTVDSDGDVRKDDILIGKWDQKTYVVTMLN
jgi:hypothetical protein